MRLLVWARAAALFVAVSVVLSRGVSTAAAQELTLADRGPRFLAVSASHAEPVEIDAPSNAVLRQVVSLDLERPTVGALLESIERQTGLRFAYDRELLSGSEPVALRAEAITVGAALTAILADAGVDVLLSSRRQVVLVKREPRVPPALADSGVIVGRVTDRATGAQLAGATVIVEGTGLSATTGTDGQYRIADVPAGTYTVRARYIGYRIGSASVRVLARDELTMDFGLDKSAQALNEVVTTGTFVPTEVKALPSPVTVIASDQIEERGIRKLDMMIRQEVPGAVSWNYEANPQSTPLSFRGASTLALGSGSIKVYLDGIEVSDRGFAAIDPHTVERIEIIRGPQAAAIYGADAISGVMQVHTKRGTVDGSGLAASLEAGFGVVESPYEGYSQTLRHEYQAALHGATPSARYHFAAGYARTGDWVAESKLNTPSAHGGVTITHGPLEIDLSGRYFVQNDHAVFNPYLSQTGWSFYSKPFYWDGKTQEQTFGARLKYQAAPSWQHSFTAGVDRLLSETNQTRPRLTTPADTLLQLTELSRTKASVSYNSALSLSIGNSTTATAVIGADHYAVRSEGYSTSGALTTTGTIATAPNRPPAASRTIIRNTGYFGQLVMGFGGAVFVTAGLRGDDNSEFGEDLGIQLAPRLGLSYVHQFGSVALKFRSSYGSAIRPPSSGQRQGTVSAVSERLANPLLHPERQEGWDVGIDFGLGSRGSIGITYYDQIARDLIQLVVLDPTSTPRVQQYQNVGRIKNSGLEVEGAVTFGRVELRGQYSNSRSRVRSVGPSYTGDLREGDQLLAVPKETAGATLTLTALQGTRITAGLVYLGAWTNYDLFAQFSCIGGTGPCGSSQRDYIVEYPGFVKFNISASRRLLAGMTGFVTVDNLTNNDASEFINSVPSAGRVTMAGLRLTFGS